MLDGQRVQPATVNEPDEIRIPGLPIYASGVELFLIAFVGVGVYFILIFIGGITQALLTLVVVWTTAWVMGKHKEGKPASWLVDLQMAIYFYPENFARLLAPRRGVVILSMHHHPIHAPFKAGAAKPGEILIDNHPSLSLAPPGVLRPGLMPRFRMEKVIPGKKGVGHWSMATADNPRPEIDVKIEYEDQPLRIRFRD